MRMRMRMKMKNLKKNEIVKDASIKELIEEPKEIKSRNWSDKNKFKEILTIIDSNKFGHKYKIGDFKYIVIKDLVNNIKVNAISEINAKKRLNTLNIIKNLFDDLPNIILTHKTLMSSKDENDNENENEDKDDYEYENQNKTIDQNKIIKGLNDILDEIVDKSKSFEEQIKLLKKRKDLKG